MPVNEWLDYETSSDFVIKALNSTKNIPSETLEILKYEIDKHLYYFGSHFRHGYDRRYHELRDQIQETTVGLISILQILEGRPNWINRLLEREQDNPIVLCNGYFDWTDHLRDQSLRVEWPIWVRDPGFGEETALLHEACNLMLKLCQTHFQVFIAAELRQLLERVMRQVTNFVGHPAFRALVVPYTQPPFENLTIREFRKRGKLTILTLHSEIGNLPCWYQQMEMDVDYYAVFGTHQANTLVNSGLSPDRVVVTGHPLYRSVPISDCRFSFDDVLVLTRSIGGAPTWSAPLISNRAHCMEFLLRVQRILQEFGVSRARLRLHPSEGPEWYNEVIDHTFYQIEEVSLNEALKRSTLIVGGASTVYLEARILGVAYVFFEPPEYNCGRYWANALGPPFDGKDPFVPIAHTDDDVRRIIRDRNTLNPIMVKARFGTSFRPERLKNLIIAHPANGHFINSSYRNTQEHDTAELQQWRQNNRQQPRA